MSQVELIPPWQCIQVREDFRSLARICFLFGLAEGFAVQKLRKSAALKHYYIYHMEPEFITYQKFDDIEIARELALVLDMHGLEYQIQDIFPSYALNVRPEDIEKVKQVLRDDDEGD